MKTENNPEDRPETLEAEAGFGGKVINFSGPRKPGVYEATERSLGDRLRKMYFAIKRDLPSGDTNLKCAIESVGTSIELGPRYYETAAVLLKSAYSQIRAEAVKAKAAEMYFLITGSQIEK